MTICVFQLGLMCIIEIISYSSYGNIETRTVVLHRARRGFGFVLRGAKASSPLMELRPSERCPGLQYLDDVDAGGVADRAGLRKGDFLVAVSCYIILTMIIFVPLKTQLLGGAQSHATNYGELCLDFLYAIASGNSSKN